MTAEDSAETREEQTITVGRLQEWLSVFAPHMELSFSGLDFYRLKQRGENVVQVEFNQPVWRDRDTGRVYIENVDSDDDENRPVLMNLVLKTRRGEIITSVQCPVVPSVGAYITVPGEPLEPVTSYKVERVEFGTVAGDLLDIADLYVSKTSRRPPQP